MALRRRLRSNFSGAYSTTGGLGRTSAGNIVYQDETAKGGEIGAKGSLVNGQLGFDLAMFSYKYDNLQVTAFNPATISYAISNAGSATTKGIELATSYKPVYLPALTFRASVAFDEATYGSFRNAECIPARLRSMVAT